MDEEGQIIWMQVRLFRLACSRWHKTVPECAKFFEEHDLYRMIYDLWDGFHIQGDVACIMDIEHILSKDGVCYADEK